MCAFVGEKYQIVLKSTFDDCEVFLFKYFEDQVLLGCEKGHFLRFLVPCYTSKYVKRKINSHQKCFIKQFVIFHQRMPTSFKNKLF